MSTTETTPASVHRTRALVALEAPARIMVRLAKHFEHRVTVERSDDQARVRFPNGECRMLADATHLAIDIESAAREDLARYQEVVARHLRQVAHDESIAVDWRD